MLVEVTHHAAVVVAAHGHVDLVFIHQARHFVNQVDRAACGATAKQHRGRAAQEFDAVEVEGVAVVERGVAQAIHKNIACGRQCKAAQANVLFAAFGRLKRDACGLFERVFDGVEVAVIQLLFGHHGDGLRNVAQLLFAFADTGFGGT